MTTLRELMRALSPTRWLILLCVALVLFGALWWFVTAPGREREKAREASASAAMAGARTASAADAAQINADAVSGAAANEALSTENADAIAKAPGAGQRLDPGLNDAGRRGMCRRPAYAQSAECLQLLGRAKPTG